MGRADPHLHPRRAPRRSRRRARAAAGLRVPRAPAHLCRTRPRRSIGPPPPSSGAASAPAIRSRSTCRTRSTIPTLSSARRRRARASRISRPSIRSACSRTRPAIPAPRILVTTNLAAMLPNALRLLDAGLVERIVVGEDEALGPSPDRDRAGPGAAGVIPFSAFLDRRRAARRLAERRCGEHCPSAIYRRHHGPAEGCGAQPREPHGGGVDVRGLVRGPGPLPAGAGPGHRRAALLPHLRADDDPPAPSALRQRDPAAHALRRGSVLNDISVKRRHRVPGRADDVDRAGEPSRHRGATTSRT